MNCPVCKYSNPAGATHCGMCYEVFNRSAAQAYLQAIRRERGQANPEEEEPRVTIISQRVVGSSPSFWERVDWKGLREQGLATLKQYWKWPALGALVMGAWMLISALLSANLWYHLLGTKLRSAYLEKRPLTYLVGMKQNIKVWSERSGRLDTPMERRSTDEMGTVIIKKLPGKRNYTAKVIVREWIQILNDDAGSSSRTIPKDHPSLASGRIVLDPRGGILERRAGNSPRLGKALTFMAAKFPTRSLRLGDTWKEYVEWVDDYEGWQIVWRGSLQWTLGELVPCENAHCAQLSSIAELQPTLRRVPSWARGLTQRVTGKATAQGRAQFGTSQKRLSANHLAYQGLLRIPISKLERIPMELRVGRRVKGAGEILIYLDNKVDTRIH